MSTLPRIGCNQRRVLEWMQRDPMARVSFVNEPDRRALVRLRELGLIDEGRMPTELGLSVLCSGGIRIKLPVIVSDIQCDQP